MRISTPLPPLRTGFQEQFCYVSTNIQRWGYSILLLTTFPDWFDNNASLRRLFFAISFQTSCNVFFFFFFFSPSSQFLTFGSQRCSFNSNNAALVRECNGNNSLSQSFYTTAVCMSGVRPSTSPALPFPSPTSVPSCSALPGEPRH